MSNTKDTPMDYKQQPLSEKDEAIRMANKALDVPNADPDDDLRTISRHFLRSIEQNASLKLELQKQKERNRELHNYIEMVVKGTIHQHSPHTQDLLRYLKEAFKKSSEI